ncbi:MAG: GNAT family N-acetyltransferase [Deferrisomatales bacterium]|nr:GNAT family N-acetyltransferase [Deferrisomatales bacterium]
MKFIIDTNVLIPLEPAGMGDLEATTPLGAEFLRLSLSGGHGVFVHDAQTADIDRDDNQERKNLRKVLIKKYPTLPASPPVTPGMEALLGVPGKGSNDWVDHQLLAALAADATDHVVTEDRKLIRKAARLGLGDRIATIAEAVDILRGLYERTPEPPPAVRALLAHELNEDDPIFGSFCRDYPEFLDWLRRCKRDHRQSWVIEVPGVGGYAAVCIVKRESETDFGLRGRLLKMCSFKVEREHSGFKFGELLLKAVFDYAFKNKFERIYIETFPKQEELIQLLSEFGFSDIGHENSRGEIRLVKECTCSKEEKDRCSPLEFNIKYGPYAVKGDGSPGFIVPIRPEYHRLLFPEAEAQLPLIHDRNPFGNALRKAYLCNSKSRRIESGSPLFFYRSHDVKGITALGVAESFVASGLPAVVARFVGKRTVYNILEIQKMCATETLALLFRQARFANRPIKLKELTGAGVMRGPPQSIVKVSEEGKAWLMQRLGV